MIDSQDPFHIGVVSLFPELFSVLHHGVIGRALKNQLIQLSLWNPRDDAPLPHQRVDDKPYGGGPGMVMCYQPLANTIEKARGCLPKHCKTIYLSPQGKRVQQTDLNQIIQQQQGVLFIVGRYEGIDERIITEYVDEEWSIGDFVLSGGELATMVFIDALGRLVPGCLGDENSAQQDSFMQGLLDYPHYTRPATIQDAVVPEVLLSGDHQKITRWRKKMSLGNTWIKRPDLLNSIELTPFDKQLLEEFIEEQTHE